MHWIAPAEKDIDSAALEKRLWDAADQFRANSGLKAQEYSGPILGLIFLRFDILLCAGSLFIKITKRNSKMSNDECRSAGVKKNLTPLFCF
jgi:hypothetical protein